MQKLEATEWRLYILAEHFEKLKVLGSNDVLKVDTVVL
jgi:hypothetical protein